MLIKFASTGLLNILLTLLQFICVVWLGRELSEGDYGKVHLVLATIPVIAAFAMGGQGSAAARFFSGRDYQKFGWRQYTFKVALGVTTVSVFAGLILLGSSTYGVVGALVCAFGAIGFGVSQVFSAGLIRAFGRPVRAVIFTRAWVVCFISGLVLIPWTDASSVIWILMGSHLAGGVAGGIYLLSQFSSGRQSTGSDVWRDGFWFWFINIAMIATRHIDRIILAGILSLSTLGAYGGLVTMMAGFDVLSLTVGFLLLPVFAKDRVIELRRRLIEVGFLTAVGVVGYLSLGPWLLNLLYDGRFDDMAQIIPILCLAGIAKAFYSVPSSLLGGRLKRAALREFSLWNIALLVVSIAATAYLGLLFGVVGIAWGTVIAWSARLLLATWLAFKYWVPVESVK